MLFRSRGRVAGRVALVATAVRNDDTPVVEFDSNRQHSTTVDYGRAGARPSPAPLSRPRPRRLRTRGSASLSRAAIAAAPSSITDARERVPPMCGKAASREAGKLRSVSFVVCRVSSIAIDSGNEDVAPPKAPQGRQYTDGGERSVTHDTPTQNEKVLKGRHNPTTPIVSEATLSRASDT